MSKKLYEKWATTADELRSLVEEHRGELMDKFDALSEKAQEGTSGEKLQEVIDILENVQTNLEDATSQLSEL